MEKQAEVTALVYQTLNSHGVLSNVRAQLRAAVFTTVIEQERKRGIEGASAGAIRGLVETTNGALAVQLMTDFMVSLGLESTLSHPGTTTRSNKSHVGNVLVVIL